MKPFRALLLASCSALVAFAAPQKFGKPLTLKEEVKIADLLATPEKFQGKKVRVKGVITWVCEKRGGTIVISAGKQKVPFKVPHDVIVFPASLKGSKAVAEGVWTVKHLSVEDQLAEAKTHDHKIEDPKALKPKTMMYLDGVTGGVETEN